MNKKKLIIIFILAFLTYIFSFGNINMSYKELFSGNFSSGHECYNYQNKLPINSVEFYKCKYKDDILNNNDNIIPSECKDEDGNINYFCDTLYYNKKLTSSFNKLNSNNVVLDKNNFPESDLIIKFDKSDKKNIQKYISYVWDGTKKIDVKQKNVIKKVNCTYPGHDASKDNKLRFLNCTLSTKCNNKIDKLPADYTAENWKTYYNCTKDKICEYPKPNEQGIRSEKDIFEYEKCTGKWAGDWKVNKDENDNEILYDNILRIFPKKKSDDLKNILINNLKDTSTKKDLLEFNKYKYNSDINNDFTKNYLKDTKPEFNDDDQIFWDTNNIIDDRFNNEEYYKDYGKGIKFVNSDFDSADIYARAKLCLQKGYVLRYNQKGEYICDFDKDKCLKNSEKESENSNKDKYSYHEWRSSGCINGTYEKIIKNFCTQKNQCNYRDNFWKYNSTNGTCKITDKYCSVMGLEERDGNCKESKGQLTEEGILGKTVIRLAKRRERGHILRSGRQCPPYTKEYRDYESEDKDDGEKLQGLIMKCLTEPNRSEEDYYNFFDPR